MKQLATSNPLASKTLSKDLIGYWCVYQRAEGSRRVRNGVRLAGDAQFDGEFLEEGTPLLDRWRGWLANGGEKLPRSFKAAGMVDMGPLFSPRDHTYLLVNGGASRLSFGGTAPFSLAVQFCAQPSGGSGGSGGGSGGGGGGSGAARAAGVLLSKFQTGLRGEYRLGVDEQLRPFFHREVEPWELVAPRAVTAGEWHEVVATYDGTTMRLFVDRRVAASAKSGAQFTDQVTPVTIGAEFGRSTVENHFDGYIAEVRIWNRALSSDEAAAVFNSSSKGTSLHRGLQAPRAEAPPLRPGPHRSTPSDHLTHHPPLPPRRRTGGRLTRSSTSPTAACSSTTPSPTARTPPPRSTRC